MSFKRMLQFSILDKYKIEYLKITYLNKSKILLSVEPVAEKCKNHKERKNVPYHAIHIINTSL